MGINQKDTGKYEQSLSHGSGAICAHNVTVDTKTCMAPNEGEYKKIYSDWCHEFERYKMAQKSWQTKQAKCSNSPLSTNDIGVFNTV